MPLGKMKVLYVIPGAEEGPNMIFVKRQIDSLSREGVIARRFFLKSRTSLREILTERRRLLQEIKVFGPDIVHAQYGTATSFLCAFGLKDRLVISFRGSDMNPSSGSNVGRSLLGRILSRLSALRALAIICVSEEIKDRLWWGRARAVVLPSGVNVRLFRPVPKKEARAALGLPQDIPMILFSGGGKQGKRMDIAVKVLGKVREQSPRTEMLVLDGWVDPGKVYLYLNSADCLLLVSDREGSPNIVKEALACDLPVVSVDVGDIRERLTGVYPSKIVPRETFALAEAVLEILGLNVRSNGREKAMELREENIARKIKSIYEKVVLEKKINVPRIL